MTDENKKGFENELNADGYRNYFSSKILPSGQTIHLVFQESWSKKYFYFNIFLEIKGKRKDNYPGLEQTGKDGLKGLLWAKNKVIEFEKFIVQEAKYINVPVILFCGWDDNRRRNAYYRGLSGCGFKYGKVYGYKVILKKINTKAVMNDRRKQSKARLLMEIFGSM